MSIVIEESNSVELKLDARMVKVKTGFYNEGYKNFPGEQIINHCPFKSAKKINEWMNKAGNVWRLRNRDVEIIEVFEKVLKSVKNE